MIDDVDFPGRVHFIAHAIRDISDRLIYVLDTQLEEQRVEYHYELDKISKQWPEINPIKYSNGDSTEHENILIRYNVASMIDTLVKAHRQSRQRPSNSELLFQYLMRKEPLEAEVNRQLVKDFERLKDWFMKYAHLRRKDPPKVDESELQTKFKIFEAMIHSFVGNFFTGKKKIDEILQKANQ